LFGTGGGRTGEFGGGGGGWGPRTGVFGGTCGVSGVVDVGVSVAVVADVVACACICVCVCVCDLGIGVTGIGACLASAVRGEGLVMLLYCGEDCVEVEVREPGIELFVCEGDVVSCAFLAIEKTVASRQV